MIVTYEQFFFFFSHENYYWEYDTGLPRPILMFITRYTQKLFATRNKTRYVTAKKI